MSYAVVVFTALVVGGEAQAHERTPQELRQAIHAALRESAPTTKPNAQLVVPQLIALLDDVAANQAMIATDRTRYRGLLKARLQAIAKRLKKDLPHANQADANVPGHNNGLHIGVLAQQAGNRPPAGANNFNPNANRNTRQNRDITVANAQQLIDLIERTIAPTTWDSAGGLGSVHYYSPFRVLVVRQTGDVHEQLGGLIGELNK
jgi:hypothetical protein